MPSYINIQNNLGATLAVTTTVTPYLDNADWGIDASSATSGQLTRLYWMNRVQGITGGRTWIFTSVLSYAGVQVQFQARLTGTLLSSDLAVQIAAGSQSSGWQTQNTDFRFTGTDGNGYYLSADFIQEGIFNDVTFVISQESRILPNIGHVVVLMMENRSFDNLLGWLYNPGDLPKQNIPVQTPTTFMGLADGNYANCTLSVNGGQPVTASEGTTAWNVNGVQYSAFAVPTPDPGEEFAHVTSQIFNGGTTADMSGFLADYTTQLGSDSAAQIMQSYSPSQVPVISGLAHAFALSDAWYASVPSQTWPNRSFLLAGSSAGHANNDYVSAWDINTIFDVLSAADMPWMVYNDGPLPALVKSMYRKYLFNETNFAKIDAFQAACAAAADAPASAKLPLFTFLEPAFALSGDYPTDESYHPPHDVRPAEKFLAEIYAMLQACAYRDQILFIVLSDEHGGCYDHIAPPTGAQPPEPDPVTTDGTDFGYSRFGVRVPAIVVSSYVTPGTVFRSTTGTPYDHTSLLATLRDWLGLSEQFKTALPSPRIAAAPNLAAVFTEKTPQAWPDIPIPAWDDPALSADSTPLNDVQIAQLLTALAMQKGKYPDAAEIAQAKEKLRTLGDAKAWMAGLNLHSPYRP